MRRKYRYLKKAVFIDRDGVINKKPPKHDYIKNWSEFLWLPNAQKAIKTFKNLGWLVIVISNQRGVSRGLMRYEEVVKIHKFIQKDLAKINTEIDAFYFCPHSIKENCSCRKPKTGLIERAKKDFHLSLRNSLVIGDSESDIIMGKKASCLTILVLTGEVKDVSELVKWEIKPDYIAKDLSKAIKFIKS